MIRTLNEATDYYPLGTEVTIIDERFPKSLKLNRYTINGIHLYKDHGALYDLVDPTKAPGLRGSKLYGLRHHSIKAC